jgi:hypothetical protein
MQNIPSHPSGKFFHLPPSENFSGQTFPGNLFRPSKTRTNHPGNLFRAIFSSHLARRLLPLIDGPTFDKRRLSTPFGQ